MNEFDPISQSGEAIGGAFDELRFKDWFGSRSVLYAQLGEVLKRKNGFYAYGGAVLFRPFGAAECPLDLVKWNDGDLWVSSYPLPPGEVLFFAEDVFGFQFSILEDGIALFDPETGLFERIASDFYDLSVKFKDDRNHLSGSPFLREWEGVNGSLAPGMRLLPKLPFVCGGAFEMANFAPVQEVEGMLFRADLCRQLREVPEGGSIIFRITE